MRGVSRTRLIRPSFFTDETMAGASIPTRFVYIGLWTLCDDAGYFELKPRQIAAALFPYDGQAKRQKVVDKALEDLAASRRVRYLDCGIHAIVPTLPKHGAKGGTKAETYLVEHRKECGVRTPPRHVRTASYESSSDSGGGSSKGEVEGRASAGDDDRPLSERMVAYGAPRSIVGGRRTA